MDDYSVLDPEKLKQYNILTSNLEEVIGENEIKQILSSGGKPKIYWGTATTGQPHLGYFVPIFKIADFLSIDCEVIILFADLHAYLDNMKTNWDLLEYRCSWYELIIKEMLKCVGITENILNKNLKFIRGTEYQLTKEYTLDMYKMSALVSVDEMKKAGSEVVKEAESPLISGLLYPILQALDEQYLEVDIQFGGIDQRKIFMFARDYMHRIGYKKRSYLMNSLVPGLTESGKMSSSEPNSKIDFSDSCKVIRKKIKSAFSIDGQAQDNCLLAISRHIIFKFLELNANKNNKNDKDDKNNETKSRFIIKQPEKFGGNIYEFLNANELEQAFQGNEICSADLKTTVAEYIIQFIKPLQEVVQKNLKLRKQAYGF